MLKTKIGDRSVVELSLCIFVTGDSTSQLFQQFVRWRESPGWLSASSVNIIHLANHRVTTLIANYSCQPDGTHWGLSVTFAHPRLLWVHVAGRQMEYSNWDKTQKHVERECLKIVWKSGCTIGLNNGWQRDWRKWKTKKMENCDTENSWNESFFIWMGANTRKEHTFWSFERSHDPRVLAFVVVLFIPFTAIIGANLYQYRTSFIFSKWL